MKKSVGDMILQTDTNLIETIDRKLTAKITVEGSIGGDVLSVQPASLSINVNSATDSDMVFRAAANCKL